MKNKGFAIIYLIPAVLALVGGFGHLPSWFYTILKVIFIMDGIFHFITFKNMLSDSETNKNASSMILLIPTFAGIIAILSMMVPGGLPKTLWVILDVAYAIMKVFIIITQSVLF